MSFLLRTLSYILINAISIWTADYFIDGFVFRGNWQDLLIAGLVLGIVNSLIRPIIKLIALPVIFLTLGLFTVIINIALLFFVAEILPTLQIETFWAAFMGVFVISITNHLLSILTKKH
ncbi:MAG: hypothetical protein COZ85_01665 [Candidatus Moranbacteria bacterium CG_4_8_14_3_um_filter_34_16]|nr:MAG: hypothetical protein COT31_00020 [Candidatus Moranbacteria bacterium CG08_land_8_20_14_0_20_34_16]PIW95107.1 MAG: hypothetical protein COZ85_01665 [Candidatus Moranbacteria bacterium CG_4_8_14_3_um_filter_34_16]PJA89344.1 MAG: hypothetical protein CO138_00945 [Candidatus Moranbacteria bacterium CG_4_9_14_3_um_filter_33_15]